MCGRTRDFALHRDDVKISLLRICFKTKAASVRSFVRYSSDPIDLLRGRRTRARLPDGSQTKRQRDANNDFDAVAAACRSTLLRRGNFLFLFRRGRVEACSSEFNANIANLIRISDSRI